jgi:DNA polymerase-3 subunit delta'
MPFASLIGNEKIKRLLKRAVAEGRIGQSLIMAGPRGVGKSRFALALAQALNCERPEAGDACGVCVPCRKIAASEHLDVQAISPDGNFIKVDQVRKIADEAEFRPFEGRRRVSIIDEADRLNLQAANSILKILEEPPETSLFVLVTSKPYALLETIRSRCQMLSFAPLAAGELEAHLAANYKRPVDENRLLARLARGSIGRALEIDLGEYREKRGQMLEMIEALTITRDTVRLMSFAEQLGRKLERDEFENHLDAVLVLLSDLFRLKIGQAGDSITNVDIQARLLRIAEAATLEEIIDWADRIEQILQNLSRNINRQLAMESLFISS